MHPSPPPIATPCHPQVVQFDAHNHITLMDLLRSQLHPILQCHDHIFNDHGAHPDHQHNDNVLHHLHDVKFDLVTIGL